MMINSRDHLQVAKSIDELFREIASYVELLQSRLIQIDSESSEGADIKVRLVELRALQTERESEFLHYQRDCQLYGLPWSAPHESLPQTRGFSHTSTSIGQLGPASTTVGGGSLPVPGEELHSLSLPLDTPPRVNLLSYAKPPPHTTASCSVSTASAQPSSVPTITTVDPNFISSPSIASAQSTDIGQIPLYTRAPIPQHLPQQHFIGTSTRAMSQALPVTPHVYRFPASTSCDVTSVLHQPVMSLHDSSKPAYTFPPSHFEFKPFQYPFPARDAGNPYHTLPNPISIGPPVAPQPPFFNHRDYGHFNAPPPLAHMNHSSTNFNSMVHAMREGFSLPKMELMTFDGNPLNFHAFMRMFDMNIHHHAHAQRPNLSISLISVAASHMNLSRIWCILNHPNKDTSTPGTPFRQDSEARTLSSKLLFDNLSTDHRSRRTILLVYVSWQHRCVIAKSSSRPGIARL